MHFRRRLTAVMATALLAVLLAMPVSAHGHHGHRRQSTVDTSCPVCTVGISTTNVSIAVMTMKAATATAPA